MMLRAGFTRAGFQGIMGFFPVMGSKILKCCMLWLGDSGDASTKDSGYCDASVAGWTPGDHRSYNRKGLLNLDIKANS